MLLKEGRVNIYRRNVLSSTLVNTAISVAKCEYQVWHIPETRRPH